MTGLPKHHLNGADFLHLKRLDAVTDTRVAASTDGSQSRFSRRIRAEVCETHPEDFDLIILGHSIPDEEKRAIIRRCLRTYQCPVLALSLVNEPPLPEADYSVDPSDTGAFVGSVQQLTDRK